MLPRPSTHDPDTGLTSPRDAVREWEANRQRDHAELRGRRWEPETVTAEGMAESRRNLEAHIKEYELSQEIKRRDFKLVRRNDGWWILTPWQHCPEMGPYGTKREASEALDSLVRNHIGNFKPSEICTERKVG